MLGVVIKELKAKQSAFLLLSPPAPQWAQESGKSGVGREGVSLPEGGHPASVMGESVTGQSFPSQEGWQSMTQDIEQMKEGQRLSLCSVTCVLRRAYLNLSMPWLPHLKTAPMNAYLVCVCWGQG